MDSVPEKQLASYCSKLIGNPSQYKELTMIVISHTVWLGCTSMGLIKKTSKHASNPFLLNAGWTEICKKSLISFSCIFTQPLLYIATGQCTFIIYNQDNPHYDKYHFRLNNVVEIYLTVISDYDKLNLGTSKNQTQSWIANKRNCRGIWWIMQSFWRQ